MTADPRRRTAARLGALFAGVACAACNSHPGFPNGAPDAAPDALPTSGDAGPDGLTVTVTLHGAPAGGAAVYFQNADSSLVAAVATDDRGTASAVLAAGGYVTVVEPDDGTGSGLTRLATFAAVGSLDALHLDLAPAGATDATALSVAVPISGGATSYQLDTSCGQILLDGSGVGSGQLIGCRGLADVLVIALADDTPVASLYTAGVAITDQPTVVQGNYQPVALAQFAYTGVPAPSTVVATLQVVETVRGSLFQASTSAMVAAGAATGTLAMPVADGALDLTVSEALPAAGDFGEQRVFEWSASSPSYGLDFASARLPVYSTAPSYDAASRTLVWTETGGSVSPSFVRAQIHAFRDGLPDGTRWSWAIVAPRGAAQSVEFPRFPGTGFDFTPRAGDVIGVDDVVNIGGPFGYDQVRAHGFDDVQSYVTGPSGRIVIETVYTPPM